MKFYTNVFQHKSNLYVKGYENNRRTSEIVKYKPYVFLNATEDAQTEFKTLDGKAVSKFDFGSIYDANEFLRTYKDVENFVIYGITDWKFQYLYENFPGVIEYDPRQINVISLDIETMSDTGFPNVELADKELTAITISKRGKKVVFGLFPYTPKSENITYIQCDDEKDLILKFLQIWQSERYAPDIVTGWYIEFFDIPYLVNRIARVFDESMAKKMSPWGLIDKKTVEVYGKEQTTYTLLGINTLDYYALYHKFGEFRQEGSKLDVIAGLELKNIKKTDISKYSSLDDLYKRNFELYIDYNIRDVELIDLFEEKLKFIELVMAFAYESKSTYNDALGTVTMWDTTIHAYLMDRAIVIPPKKHIDISGKIPGGYVREPKIGLSKWVVSFDLSSLYPSLIMGLNISPETYVGKSEQQISIEDFLDGKLVKNKDYCYAANGTLYSRQKQGFLPALMEKMFQDRLKYRGNMDDAENKLQDKTLKDEQKTVLENQKSIYHNLQYSTKIKLNGGYGALLNEYFRWYHPEMASAITMTGQLTARWIHKHINIYFNRLLSTVDVEYVIAGDTDSIFLNMESLVEKIGETNPYKITKMLDQFCKNKIQPKLEEIFKELSIYLNSYQQKMDMKRENIANKGIWRAKKMYILNVYSKENIFYDVPRLKIVGIEAVRSTTPMVCRTAIKKSLELIMNKEENDLQSYISEFKKNFRILLPNEVATPSGINGLDKYYSKNEVYTLGTPAHVKAALIYNHLLKEYNLTNKYQNIQNGDKIKWVKLKMPNPIGQPTIAMSDILPPEFDLEKYIDYEGQFEKTFVASVESITDVIGWKTTKTNTLDNFFN